MDALIARADAIKPLSELKKGKGRETGNGKTKAKTEAKSKGKAKENITAQKRRVGKPHSTSRGLGDDMASESKWDWVSLTDPCISKVPPIFTKDGRCVAKFYALHLTGLSSSTVITLH